jgi:hypothetical protein
MQEAMHGLWQTLSCVMKEQHTNMQCMCTVPALYRCIPQLCCCGSWGFLLLLLLLLQQLLVLLLLLCCCSSGIAHAQAAAAKLAGTQLPGPLHAWLQLQHRRWLECAPPCTATVHASMDAAVYTATPALLCIVQLAPQLLSRLHDAAHCCIETGAQLQSLGLA